MTTAAELDARYGRSRSRRNVWILGVLLSAATLALGAWWASAGVFTTADATDLGYVVVDEHSVDVAFSVTSTTGRDAYCALKALDEEFGVVGWKIVLVPASEEYTQGFRESIPTVAEATTGLVHSCWVD